MKSFALLILVFCLVSLSSQQNCTQNGTRCSFCNFYCTSQIPPDDQCGIKLSANTSFVLNRTSSTKQDIKFIFKDGYCTLGELSFLGSTNLSWNISLEPLYSEATLIGGSINVENVNYFNFQRIKYSAQEQSTENLFNLLDVKSFSMRNSSFSISDFRRSWSGRLINSNNSNILLDNMNLTGLGSQDQTTQLIFLQENNNLTINGTSVEISNNQAQDSLFRAQGNGNRISIKAKTIRISQNIIKDYGVFFLNSYSDQAKSLLEINSQENLVIEDNQGSTQSTFLFLSHSVANISAGQNISFSRNSKQNIPLFQIGSGQNILSISAQNKLKFSQNKGSIFIRQTQSRDLSNLQVYGKDIEFDNNQGLLNITDRAIINLAAQSSIQFTRLLDLSYLKDSTLNIQGQNVSFTNCKYFLSMDNSNLLINGQNGVSVSNPSQRGSVFLYQDTSNNVTITSKSSIKLDHYFDRFFSQYLQNSLTIESGQSLEVQISPVTIPIDQFFIHSYRFNSINLRSQLQMSFQSQSSNFSRNTLFFMDSNGTLKIYSAQNILIGGKSYTLPSWNPSQLYDYAFLLRYTHSKISIVSEGDIIIENIATTSRILWVSNSSWAASNRSFNITAKSNIIFRNVTSNRNFLEFTSDLGTMRIQALSGGIEFQGIRSNNTFLTVGGQSPLYILGYSFLRFHEMGGFINKPMDYLFYISHHYGQLKLESNGPITIAKINSIKGNSSVYESMILTLWGLNGNFYIRSNQTVDIIRETESASYQIRYENDNIEVDWYYQSIYPISPLQTDNRTSGAFVRCLTNCQRCTNGQTCEACGYGAQLSADKTRCMLQGYNEEEYFSDQIAEVTNPQKTFLSLFD